MKRIFIFISIMALSIAISFAQEKPDANKMVQDRVANMKSKLKLDANESKVFWQAYEQFIRTEIKAHDAFRTNLEKQGIKHHCPNCASNENVEMTDAQIKYFYDQKMELRKRLLDNDIAFHKKIKAILTPKHMQAFYKIDEQYKRNLAKKANSDKSKTQQTPVQTQKRR